jgi:MoaA/NifB/PqqE/SkfB family radical SAM enzyme
MRADTIARPEAPDRSLSFLWVELTNSCSLRCLHCYAESAPGSGAIVDSLDFEAYVSVLDEARANGCEAVQFIGGEPTLFAQLADLISYADAVGFTFIEVFTNAVRITDHLFQSIVRHNVRIATSLYSAEPSVHDAITQRSGSHAATSANVSRLVGAGISVRAGFIEMNENEGHFDAAAGYANALGIVTIGYDRVRNVGRGNEVAFKGRGSGSESFPMPDVCGSCWRGSLCVAADGQIHPCIMAKAWTLGTVADGLGSVLQSETLLRVRSEIFENVWLPAQQGPPCPPQGGCGPQHPCAPNCSPSCPPFGPCPPTCSPSCNPTVPCPPSYRCLPG